MEQVSSTGGAPPNPFMISLATFDGYKARLILQMVLFSMGIILGIAYLVLSTLEARRIGKPLRLFRLQPVAGTHLIALNAIWLFVFFDTLDLAALLAHKVVEYRMYFHHASQHNYPLLTLYIWIPGFFAGFAYTFNILGASLKLRGEGTGWSSASYLSVWAYNGAFVFVVAAFLALHIPLSFVANRHFNLVCQGYEVARTLLQEAQAEVDPSNVSSSLLAGIKAATEEVAYQTLEFCRYQKIVASVIVIFPIGFAVAAAASFSLVLLLRKQRKWRNRVVGQSASTDGIVVFQEQHVHYEIDNESRDVPIGDQLVKQEPSLRPVSCSVTGAPFKSRAMSMSCGRPADLQLKASIRQSPNADVVLMDRLTKDLCVSVPLICLVCTFFDIAAIVTAVHAYDRSWLWREWPADVYGWTQAVCVIPIFSTFLWNLNTHQMQDATHNTSTGKHSSGLGSQTSKIQNVQVFRGEEMDNGLVKSPVNKKDNLVTVSMVPLGQGEKAEEVLQDTAELPLHSR